MRSAAALTAAGALLVLTPPAVAATSVEVEKPCYAEGSAIEIEGRGFSPGGGVDLSLERATGTVLERTSAPVAEQDGVVAGTYGVAEDTGWFGSRQSRFRMTVRLVDRTRRDAGQPLESPDVTATTSFVFSRWSVAVATPGGRIHPRRRLRYKAVGYTSAIGKPLYAHWTRGRRRVFTKRLGVLRGPCGNRRGRLKRGFPFRPVRRGRYRVRFNTSRTNAFARRTFTHRAVRVRRTLR